MNIPKFSDLKTKPKILIGICSPLVLLMMLGGISVYSIQSIVGTNKMVDHTYVVLGDAASIVSSAVDMETGMRSRSEVSFTAATAPVTARCSSPNWRRNATVAAGSEPGSVVSVKRTTSNVCDSPRAVSTPSTRLARLTV